MARHPVTRRGFCRVALAGAASIVVPVRFAAAQQNPAGSAAAVTLDDLNRMDRAGFVAVMGGTFDRAPWVADSVYDKRPFATVTALHQAMFDVLRDAPRDRQAVFFGKHVDALVTGKAAAAAVVSDESRREHSLIGLDRWSDADSARYQALNQAYEARFGYAFIIAVLRYTREATLAQIERRIRNDPSAEFAKTLREVFDISRLRVAARVTGPGMPRVSGSLDTHVLDATSGGPAAGMTIELFELAGDEAVRIAQSTTNAGGRNATPLIAGRPVPIGRYELRFGVGDYFSTRARGLADPPFLDVVPLRFAVADPESHYHVPLLCTPWSYSTYKGSG
jgi:2-oxo-4-hydroxy-4-carboxy-5-ureidoimidazoline decarboxylase